MTHLTRSLALVAVPAVLLTSAWLYAGPLDPPPGPITSTMKTLTEVEPRIAVNAVNTPGDNDATPSLFKISQPGSYYLTGNITGVVGKHGIEIAASGVTLDLMGFDLAGVPAMGAFDGVTCTVVNANDLAVANGSINGWGQDGLDFRTALAINGTIRFLRASNNGAVGIRAGFGYTVADCSLKSNNLGGLTTGNGCTISDCTAYQNIGDGISTDDGSTVTHCAASQNTGNGILTGNGSTVSSCSARGNSASGISVASGSTVADCTAGPNALDGIRCQLQCVIRGNTCYFNGNPGNGAGIHATGADNRIEGNNCTSADRGIDVDAGGNIIIKNTCSGNTTNWDLAANNYYGPIIDRTGVASPAVVGAAQPVSSLGSTDSNANFSY